MILFVQSHEFKNVNRGAEGVYRSHGNGFEVIAKRGASADRAGFWRLALGLANCSFKSMFCSLLLASSLALFYGCASNPEPMRTGIVPNSRFHPPGPAAPIVNGDNP